MSSTPASIGIYCSVCCHVEYFPSTSKDFCNLGQIRISGHDITSFFCQIFAKGAWFALGYPYDFIVTPVWLPSAMLLDLAYWATKRNKHSLILFGGVLVGMSLPLFNMVNLITVADPLETAFKYPRPTLPPYMTPIEPQVGKFYNSPVALGAGAGAVLSVTMAALGVKLNTWTYRWMAAWSKWD